MSLAELISGDESEHSLAVYLLSGDEELLGCAFLKKLDEDAAAEYNELFNGPSEVAVKDDTSSGSKNGLFVFVSIIAAVAIAVVLGDVLAM